MALRDGLASLFGSSDLGPRQKKAKGIYEEWKTLNSQGRFEDARLLLSEVKNPGLFYHEDVNGGCYVYPDGLPPSLSAFQKRHCGRIHISSHGCDVCQEIERQATLAQVERERQAAAEKLAEKMRRREAKEAEVYRAFTLVAKLTIARLRPEERDLPHTDLFEGDDLDFFE